MIRPRLSFSVVAALLALFAVPALVEQSRDVDVLLYMAAAARANAAGALPYTAAWIEKGPLAMGLFQAAAAAFGRYSFPGLALVWLALALIGARLTQALAREAGATWSAGWAALCFAVGIGAVGGTLNTEVPAMALAAGACLVWWRGVRGARAIGPSCAAGALAGAAFLCRQNAGVLWPAIVVLEAALVAKGFRTRAAAGRAVLALSAGFGLPCAAVAAAYAATGGWNAFVFCFWGYNADIYLAATHVSAARMALVPWAIVANFLWPVRTTALLAAAGAVTAWPAIRRARPAVPEGAFVAALVGVVTALVVGMIPGLRFFSHYAALALPFAAALAAVGLEALIARAGARAGVVLALVAFALGTEIAERGWLDTASRLSRWAARGGFRRLADPLEWPGRDETVVPVAAWLREHGSPGDRVFVWGMRPHIPVYAGRLAATRFVTCTFLTGLVPWERVAPGEDTSPWIVPGAWDLLEADLAAERPRFIVDASQDHIFGEGAYAPERFPRLQSVLDREYERVFATEGRDRFVVWRRRPD